LLSSGSGLFFGEGGALSLAIPDWENTGREKAGGNPYGICRRRIGKSSLSFLLFLLWGRRKWCAKLGRQGNPRNALPGLPCINTKGIHSVRAQRWPGSSTETVLPLLLSPPQLLFRLCNRKGTFILHLGQNMWQPSNGHCQLNGSPPDMTTT